jgi:hypothetical protein
VNAASKPAIFEGWTEPLSSKLETAIQQSANQDKIVLQIAGTSQNPHPTTLELKLEPIQKKPN